MNGAHRGLPIGRIAGIRIEIDYSWVFIVLLLTWSLASWFAVAHPSWSAALGIATALAGAILFFATVLLHELAHSLVARLFHIPVSKITLFLLGGVSNIEREPPSPKAEFLMAFVGPLTSIVLGVVLLWIGSAVVSVPPDAVADPQLLLARLGPAESLLMWLGPINLIVGLFNLVPAFPLDGGRVLRSAIWAATRSLHVATRWASAIGQGVGWLFVLLGVAMVFGMHVPFFGRGLIGGLWLAFLGWFLVTAAERTWSTQLAHEVLHGLPVARLMRPAEWVVSPETSVSSLVKDWLRNRDQQTYPVVDASGRLRGIATLSDVRKTRRDMWDSTPISSVMTPYGALVTASPYEDLAAAFDKLASSRMSELPVVEDGRLEGLLHRLDIARWIDLHTRPPMHAAAP